MTQMNMSREKRIFTAVMAMASILLASCSVNDNVGPVPDHGSGSTQLCLTVNGEAYDIDPTVTDTVDLRTLSTEFDAQIRVTDPDRFDWISVNGILLRNGAGRIPVNDIAKDSYLTLCWSAGGKTETVSLRTLHSGIPGSVATGTATAPGDFYLSFVYLRLIEKMDNSGRILYYRYDPLPEEDCNTSRSIGWWDFKKHVIDGNVCYSYHASDKKFHDWGFSGYNPGSRIVTDEHYNPIDTLQLLPSRDGFIQDGDPIDGHDFYLIDRGHYIMSAYILRDGVYAAYLQEVKDGEVVFDWWSTDHSEMSAPLEACFEKTAGADYVHFNSIDIMPDGNWLCSFRHISTITKIDRAGETGRVLWSLRGTNLEDGADFHGQHYVRWHENDSTITLFNNANGVFHSRMLRLKVDPDTGEMKDHAVLCDDGYFSVACGALSFSHGNMIVGWGMPGNNADCDRIVSEYDADGNEIFSLRRESNALDQNVFFCSYRCVKCE